jgi:uncharacterized protein
MAKASPCTDICQYDPRSKWCVGCGRTAEEIRGWRKMSPFHRTVISKELQRRLDRIRQDAAKASKGT